MFTSFASFCSLIFSAMYFTLSMASLISGESGRRDMIPSSRDSELLNCVSPPIPIAPPPLSAPRQPSPPLPPPESEGSLPDLFCQQQLQRSPLPGNPELAHLFESPLLLLRFESSVLFSIRWRFVRLDIILDPGARALCFCRVPDECTVQGLKCTVWTLLPTATFSGSLSGLVMNITRGSSPRKTRRTQQGMVCVFGVR